MEYFGFLNLHKGAGWTSHDCVAKVRRLLKLKRVGHGGTLDPAATGVLPIALGRATRLLQYLPTAKSYRGRVRFGVTTTTDDLEGEILTQQPAPDLTLAQIMAQLPRFLGEIEQIPPAFSAIQRDGQRLYDLARAGVQVEVPARRVVVTGLRAIAFTPGDFPELELEIDCGPGTYIRAIARDLGAALGVGGTLAALVRTRSCGLDLAGAMDLEQLANQLERGEFTPIPPERLLTHLPRYDLEPEAARRWCQGQGIVGDFVVGAIAQVWAEDEAFLGVGEVLPERGLIPKVVLV
ncbi:tRNA pseudouridine(55) synthase TruB [Spirulina sp. CCNP1310]|uniref:tRNA pseudouridine(55) synthase TruB n=1 Tax=Spirulina sp. CCNP1310 TaxID=3110249 RepID=UPI002B20EA6B|nr:tRNA pseudouridine(55) synthase TruB [Spirulina sp. CCNP1310]MEA5418113.1 tRNA pseudouridine(55) synthase TruB [Spirulina sp. CCNP1310]